MRKESIDPLLHLALRWGQRVLGWGKVAGEETVGLAHIGKTNIVSIC